VDLSAARARAMEGLEMEGNQLQALLPWPWAAT